MNSHHTISFLLILLLALSGCEQFNPNKKAYKENKKQLSKKEEIGYIDTFYDKYYKKFY